MLHTSMAILNLSALVDGHFFKVSRHSLFEYGLSLESDILSEPHLSVSYLRYIPVISILGFQGPFSLQTRAVSDQIYIPPKPISNLPWDTRHLSASVSPSNTAAISADLISQHVVRPEYSNRSGRPLAT
jgi:hypothetical protein